MQLGGKKRRKKKPSKGEKREEEATGRIRWGKSEAKSEIEEEATGTWGERESFLINQKNKK